MLITEQVIDLSWKDAWLHELRAPDGRWMTGLALAKVAKNAPNVPVRKVNPKDFVLAYGNDDKYKPMQVAMILPHKEHIDFKLSDPDGGDLKTLHLDPDGHVTRVGVTHEGGEVVSTLPQKTPAAPGPVKNDVHERVEKAAAKLEADWATGVKSVSKPHAKRGLKQGGEGVNYFGNTADTSVVTFGNGHKWIRKRGLGRDEVSNEILASRVGAALGTHAPVVMSHKDLPDQPVDMYNLPLWEPFADGSPKTAIEWMGGVDEDGDSLGGNDPYDMYTSPQGRRIGILDDLTANGDRHYGNWMVGHNAKEGEYPIPIDHGMAGDYADGSADYGSGDFGEALLDEGADGIGKITPAEWDEMEANLKSIESDFTDEDRHMDYAMMMETFAKLRADSDDYREGGFA